MSLRKQPTICLNCGISKRMATSSFNKYCSHKCQHEHRTKEEIEAWKNNIISPVNRKIKKMLLYMGYTNCSVCNISEWNGKPLVLEIEHKDGNSENNTIDNVCFICPNCHSQTSTYKGANRGNGRHARRIRYAEGKSY